jgi:hypothetical protein
LGFVFAGHTDVVPVGDNWKTKPFQPEVIDGLLYGPLSFGVSESMAIKSLANCSVLLVTTLILPLDCLSHQ